MKRFKTTQNGLGKNIECEFTTSKDGLDFKIYSKDYDVNIHFSSQDVINLCEEVSEYVLEENLEPCPWCGEQPILTEEDGGCLVKCDNGGCWVKPKTIIFSRKQTKQACDKWNECKDEQW